MFDVSLGIMKAVDRRKVERPIQAAIGLAASETGDGIAYALLGLVGSGGAVVRVAFRCPALPALQGRDVAYAAVLAVAGEVRSRGVRRVVFAVEDERLVRDLDERAAVPAPLAVPYVSLRCALNRFSEARVVVSGESVVRDLSARARAEVFLQPAA
jgi:hypothetical protein